MTSEDRKYLLERIQTAREKLNQLERRVIEHQVDVPLAKGLSGVLLDVETLMEGIQESERYW
jgi:hypothetical protein